jgi:hypothetical protein
MMRERNHETAMIEPDTPASALMGNGAGDGGALSAGARRMAASLSQVIDEQIDRNAARELSYTDQHVGE